MVFRPGASRFVLITDTANLVLAPLLDWKEKLERLAGYPVGSPFPGGGTQRDLADMLAQTDNFELDDVEEVPAWGSSRRVSFPGGANAERGTSISQLRKRSSRHRLRRSTVFQPIAEGELSYYVVDLLRDCPRIPAPTVWGVLRDKLREERKNFRSEIYRFKLEIDRYQQHERDRRQLVVLDKFKEFFTVECPRHPHFRSLISHRKMEALVRQTIEFVKTSQPYNPKFMLSS
ncbi:Acetyl-coenzyme A synthetase [Phytophthora cinnamomi]|uniref:Acetyl-coenzyme A synthetase n=1 Tax=Phytophthora cinnamomi TaxID=4785 RepID=UPI0035596391|nr:Acetyl-coenzyme A synthetase [Phytophthora cinnamomi]